MMLKKVNKRVSLFEIAEIIKGRLIGDGSVQVTGLAPLEETRTEDLTFLIPGHGRQPEDLLAVNTAGCLVKPDFKPEQSKCTLIEVPDPYKSFIELIAIFYEPLEINQGIDAAAIIHPTAILEAGVTVMAGVVVEENVFIGAKTIIYPQVYLGPYSKIGSECIIYPHATIMHNVTIGNKVIIHSNAVIGSDGFGFLTREGKHYKIPQVGSVILEDEVEIGAGTTIDRATFGYTYIARGVKIDNLVQLGHNVKVGEDTLIVAQVGVSGSTEIGSRCRIGGQVGIQGHIEIGDNVSIGAKGGVTKSIRSGKVVAGFPALDYNEWRRKEASLAHLPKLVEQIKSLKEKIANLEAQISSTGA